MATRVKGTISRMTNKGNMVSDVRFPQVRGAKVSGPNDVVPGNRMHRARISADPVRGRRVKRVGPASRAGMTGSLGMGNVGSEKLGL